MVLFFRAGKGTRTLDPDLGKVVLYQLSYSREGDPYIEIKFVVIKGCGPKKVKIFLRAAKEFSRTLDPKGSNIRPISTQK